MGEARPPPFCGQDKLRSGLEALRYNTKDVTAVGNRASTRWTHIGRTALARRRAAVVLSIGATAFALFLGAGLQRKLTASVVDPPEPIAARVLTFHNDVGRTGQNLEEKILTLKNVKPEGFGKVGFLHTAGLVDAEPLYVPNLTIGGRTHNVVFVATEHDLV